MYQSRFGSSLEDLDRWNHSCCIEYHHIRKDQSVHCQFPRSQGLKPKARHLIGRVVDDEVHPVGKKDATEGNEYHLEWNLDLDVTRRR